MTDYKLMPKSIVDELAQFIRQADGNNKMGAGSLAEKICERFHVADPAVQGEPVSLAASAQKPVGYVSQDFLDGKWSLDHIAKSDEGQISRTIPLYAAPQPAVQVEPVGWQFYQDGKWWGGDDRIKDHRKNTEEAGYPIRDVYVSSTCTPKQQPAADVAGLLICDECHDKCADPYTGLFASHCPDEEPCIMCECSSLRRQLAEQQPASRPWSYCPERGSEHVHHHEGEHKQCANCHQEWFSGTDYTDVFFVRKHLAGKFRDKDAEIERLRSSESTQHAPDVDGLVTLLEHARCNTCDGSGAVYDDHGQALNCQWCHDRSTALATYRKQGGEA